MDGLLKLGGILPLDTHSVGILLSRGKGRHIERTASYFVLLFVRKGVLYIEEDGREFEVREGESLLLWPGRLHRGTRDLDANLQFFWLHFSVAEGGEEQNLLEVPQHVKVTRPDSVTELFRRLMDDQNSGYKQPLRAALYTWMILLEIGDTPPTEDKSTATPAGAAFIYIRTHFHEKISASKVASAVGYSPQYLGRVFQQNYNMTVAEAIRRARVDLARTLLLHTNNSASEIAHQCGFKNAAYFQRVFKQIEGVPPLRFRRLHAQMWINTH